MSGSMLHKSKIEELVFLLDQAWFVLSRNTNGPNNRCWCYKNIYTVYEVPVYHLNLES
jgi:hypothetical protein